MRCIKIFLAFDPTAVETFFDKGQIFQEILYDLWAILLQPADVLNISSVSAAKLQCSLVDSSVSTHETLLLSSRYRTIIEKFLLPLPADVLNILIVFTIVTIRRSPLLCQPCRSEQ